MLQATCCRPFTAKLRVPSQPSSCNNCGRKSGTGQVFHQKLRSSPVSIIPAILDTHHLNFSLITGINERRLGTSEETLLRKPGQWTEEYQDFNKITKSVLH